MYCMEQFLVRCGDLPQYNSCDRELTSLPWTSYYDRIVYLVSSNDLKESIRGNCSCFLWNVQCVAEYKPNAIGNRQGL